MPQTVLSKKDMVHLLRHGRIRDWNRYRKDNPGRVDLCGVKLRSANLMDADLSLADLSRAKLNKTNLQHTNLSGAHLVDADLRGANYVYATMSSAQLALFHKAQDKTIVITD